MLYPNNKLAAEALQGWLDRNYRPINPQKIYSLVLLSGGLDSVALLAGLLQQTEHEVHAHHVEIINTENRAHAENLALVNILDYMNRNYRKFTYSTSTYQVKIITPDFRVGSDASTAMFMAARVNMALGFINDFVWTGHMRGVMWEYMEAAAIHAACYTNVKTKPIWAMPYSSVSKFNLYNSIPPELADMTWSCRTPVYDEKWNPSPCNNCHACSAMNTVRLQTDRLKPRRS